jgi:hypothetical protein
MSEQELKKMESMPEWDTLEDVISYFNKGLTATSVALTRLMWEVGRAGEIMKTEAKYGDNAIEAFAVGIKKGTSWVYECIKMYNSYTWEDIENKFIAAGMPPSSIARLGSIKDDGARNYVEDKLVSGEITYEEITKAKKEYENVVSNVEAQNTAAYDINEQTLGEAHTIDQLGPEDPSSIASNKIRRECTKTGRAIENCRTEVGDIYKAFRNEIDNVADGSLYEISEERFCDVVELALTLRPLLDELEAEARKMRPDRFPESK